MPGTHSKPLLIIGSGGQLGQDLVRACERRHIACKRTQRQGAADSLPLDLSEEQDFKALLGGLEPGCVLNAAAYTAVDAAENDSAAAWQINARAPGRLAAACRHLDIPLVHFSTDYVFSGHPARAWREDDECAPLNVYGKSKAGGEERIRENAGSYYIFRGSWLYSPGHRNFVTTMLRLYRAGESVRVVDDQHGCPTWTRYLAEAVVEFIQRELPDRDRFAAASGTYHLCAQRHTSWFEFARMIADLAQPPPHRRPQAIASCDYAAAAARPAWSVLDCDRAATRLGLRLPPWRQQLGEAMPLFNAIQAGGRG